MTLIDADRLRRVLNKNFGGIGGELALEQLIEKQPTVDAVPVVRCGECKLHGSCTFEETLITARLDESRRYCGAGKRKGGKGNT